MAARPRLVIAGNVGGLPCIGWCVCFCRPANFLLKAPPKLSAAKDSIASPESDSNEVNTFNATVFPGVNFGDPSAPPPHALHGQSRSRLAWGSVWDPMQRLLVRYSRCP